MSGTFPSTPHQGNLLVAIVGAGSTTAVTFTAPTGWTSAFVQSTAPSQAMFYKVAGASEPTTVQITASSVETTLGLQLYEFDYTGMDTDISLLEGRLHIRGQHLHSVLRPLDGFSGRAPPGGGHDHPVRYQLHLGQPI